MVESERQGADARSPEIDLAQLRPLLREIGCRHPFRRIRVKCLPAIIKKQRRVRSYYAWWQGNDDLRLSDSNPINSYWLKYKRIGLTLTTSKPLYIRARFVRDWIIACMVGGV